MEELFKVKLTYAFAFCLVYPEPGIVLTGYDFVP
jgi:hypothetical protein